VGVSLAPSDYEPFTRLVLSILLVATVIGAIFAPDGFFSGHRQVVLKAETTVSESKVHLSGANNRETAIVSGTILSQGNLPAYAIEGGLGGFICLDPDGDTK
jgi:hypothetical protein